MSFTSLFWASWQFLLSSYLLIILLLGLSAVIVNGVYNRYFHPLSKFPGPFWASVTDLYLVYMISSVPTYGLELHKKHGMFYERSNSPKPTSQSADGSFI